MIYIKKTSQLSAAICVAISVFLIGCGGNLNSVNDSHFTEDGKLIKDSTDTVTFVPEVPSAVKFYVEVSGSMNGFFCSNHPTDFKKDVWQILSYYKGLTPGVTILTNDGASGANINMPEFQTMMNTGAFVSSASTKVPTMLSTIISNLKVHKNEVAVLISDMKYSPVGMAAPNVLMSQYSTDVSNIIGGFGKAVSLVGAISNYMDKVGNIICDKSPYYYLILGNGRNVAEIRNTISTMLTINNHFIDNIESGFNFSAPPHTFGIPRNCVQLISQPTFYDYDSSSEDTCFIKVKINLENYRWIMADTKYLRKAFIAKSIYGSQVRVGHITTEVENITNKELKRKVTGIVELEVFNMPMDADVIEWTLKLPDADYTKFAPYLGADSENDITKSYSVDNFIKGIFQNGLISKGLKPNYILISKNS